MSTPEIGRSHFRSKPCCATPPSCCPLIRSEAEWNSTAMLDGVPLPLEWRDAGRACAIEIAEPGRYSLSLSCVPKTTTAEGRNQIDLAIPPILGAKAEVRYPETVTGVTVASASVLPPPTGPSNTFCAELDRTNRLQVQWSRTEKSENGASGFSITELRWLHVKPDELETTVKYVLEGGARRPDCDHRRVQRPLEIVNNRKITERQELRCRLRRSTRYSHSRSSPIHRPPGDYHCVGDWWIRRVGKSSLAADRVDFDSTHEALARDVERPRARLRNSRRLGHRRARPTSFSPNGATPIPAIRREWVLSNFDPRRASNLAIRPRETEPIVEESLNVSAGLTALRANYEARSTPGMAGANRVELSVPANLTINEITVTEDDRPIPVRWSRSAKNRVNVFFAQQLTKPYRLVLDGTTPVDSDGKAPLPHISTLATEDATQKIRLYRDDDVHVDVEGLPAKNDPKAEPPARLHPNGPSARSRFATWKVTPRPRESSSSQTSSRSLAIHSPRLTRENGTWWANYRCQLIGRRRQSSTSCDCDCPTTASARSKSSPPFRSQLNSKHSMTKLAPYPSVSQHQSPRAVASTCEFARRSSRRLERKFPSPQSLSNRSPAATAISAYPNPPIRRQLPGQKPASARPPCRRNSAQLPPLQLRLVILRSSAIHSKSPVAHQPLPKSRRKSVWPIQRLSPATSARNESPLA